MIYTTKVEKLGLLTAWVVLRDGALIAGGYEPKQADARAIAEDYRTALNKRLSKLNPTTSHVRNPVPAYCA